MAHAPGQTLVTVERLQSDDLLADPRTAAGTIPSLYVSMIAEVKHGARPLGLWGCYGPDHAELMRYSELAKTHDGFEAYLQDDLPAWFMEATHQEFLISTIADLIGDVGHVAVGAASPIPAAAALLARHRSESQLRVSLLGSERLSPFTDGGCELFDCAAQGRVDMFFLGGAQIDGYANINLVGIGDYPFLVRRFPRSFGSAQLYYLVPRVILFVPEHTRRVLVEHVDFISAAGSSAKNIYRRGGPYALVTGRCIFRFDRNARRFTLSSVHPGQNVDDIIKYTGFKFVVPDHVPTTTPPTPSTLIALRSLVLAQLADVYPRFVNEINRDSLQIKGPTVSMDDH